MRRGHSKDKPIDKASVKQILGRIFRLRHSEEGEESSVFPFLLVKERSIRVDLARIINAITQNPSCNDYEIVGLVGVQGTTPSDIESVRAYIHRFGIDLAKPLPIEAHPQHTLLLDENIPQPAMLPLSKNFGWATHVAAEGFSGRNTPDEDIWEFASDKNFGAIVTRDTDFLEIQERRAKEAQDAGLAAPFLIFVDGNVSTESLTGIFSRHKKSIERYMNGVTCLAISVNAEAAPKPLF